MLVEKWLIVGRGSQFEVVDVVDLPQVAGPNNLVIDAAGVNVVGCVQDFVWVATSSRGPELS